MLLLLLLLLLVRMNCSFRYTPSHCGGDDHHHHQQQLLLLLPRPLHQLVVAALLF